MRLILTENIKDDMSLAQPIYYNNNVLLNIGVKNLNKYKNKLIDLGINHIYIEDKYSFDIKISQPIREKTRRKGKKVITKIFEEVKNGSTDIEINQLNNIVEDIISDLTNEEGIIDNLVSLKNISDYTFEHSINVSVLAIIFGKRLQYTFDDLRKIGMGSILHDIGKMLIPEEILNKPSSLTDYEYQVIQNHPELGFKHLQKLDVLSPLSRTVVYAHHEKIDGSGYPRGLEKDQIHEFAKVAGIADVFDALTSERVYRKRWPTHKAVDYIISNTDSFFDHEIVKKLMPKIASYPNGTEVILSTGERGVIKEQNINFPTRPIIKVFKDQDGKEIEQEINLLENTNITVAKVII
jgi:HD-GYP domain-containing protein (c-di-GMP phosphodiesterase class II)